MKLLKSLGHPGGLPVGLARCSTRNARNRTFSRSSFRALATSSNQRSSGAPSYSSTGTVHTCVSKLDLNHITSVCYLGRPNPPLPDRYNIDIDEFLEGAVGAVEVVTRNISDGNYSNLEELVSEDCISGLKQQNLHTLSEENRKLLAVNSGDIFFRMATNIVVSDSLTSVLLVTFSLPDLEKIKTQIGQMKQDTQELNAKMKSLVSDLSSGAVDKADFKQMTEDNLKEHKEKMRQNDYFKQFKDSQIVIGNCTFKKSGSSDWVVTDIAQVNSTLAWHPIFRYRWKGRLGIHLRGVDFYKLLRWEYLTDWGVILLFVTFTLASTIGQS